MAESHPDLQLEIAHVLFIDICWATSHQAFARRKSARCGEADAKRQCLFTFLRARDHDLRGVLQANAHEFELAHQAYEQAIALDSSFALAHAGLSIDLSNFRRTEANTAKARAEAEVALQLQPGLGEVHLAMGLCLMNNNEHEQSLKELEIARRALPNDAEVLTVIALLHQIQGHWGDSLAQFEQARALDPRNAATADG